jgi:hypothetical protein
MEKQGIQYFSNFDENNIYGKKYLLEQVFHLYSKKCGIVGKYNIPIFIPKYNNFYTNTNSDCKNKYLNTCNINTITFNINTIKHKFDIKGEKNIEKNFLDKILKDNKKIFITSFYNYIIFLDLKKNKINLDQFTKIDNPSIIYKLYINLIKFKMIDVSHLMVSVIITMYNSSKTIYKCLYSILNQTHKNIEIIIVDDNSSDNSINIVEKMMQNNNNIKLINNKQNRGTYYCKNCALNQLSKKTRYIIFQDSDDFSHCERVRKQIEILYFNNGKASMTLCRRYNRFRYALVSNVYDISVFKQLGFFDDVRFGADSEYLYRFYTLYKLDNALCSLEYFKNKLHQNIPNMYYLIPNFLYIINCNDEKCLTNQIPLGSKKRRDYVDIFKKKVDNLDNLYKEFKDNKSNSQPDL